MEVGSQHQLPPTLLELLSNTLVLDATLPYLALPTVLRLSAVSTAFHRLIYETPRVFRFLDLHRCRGAYVPPSVMPVDSGGHSWRAERLDENLTEDEFYSGPLRGIHTKLSKIGVMKDVQTLVLDGLGSVTHDVLSDILLSDQCNVRILSVIGCKNLNQRKFQRLLHYMCRPGRPEGSPRLKGVYVFGTNEAVAKQSQSRISASREGGVTALLGAQIGASTTSPPTITTTYPQSNPNPWFSPTGLVLPLLILEPNTWAETLRVCSGIIAFDAVLCTHMHSEMAPYRSDAMNTYLASSAMTMPIATYALGSGGCAGCGAAPDDAPVWGQSDVTAFPLASPPPFSGRLVDAVRPPSIPGSSQEQRLVVGCTWCLSDRHCQCCHRYWCGRCYDPQRRKRALQLEAQAEHEEGDAGAVAEELKRAEGASNTIIKVYNGLCTQYCAFSEDVAAGNGAMWG
ncbi:hypothetical protein EPUS_01932 [Endocarpon pusillum Z07020]|uniref:F-box domain-containing protein n=1 Tax=Endocarpon pusillum (strain Z07020 / HMAS-L-300199) TaxID=1263415 RepID=U1FXJ3_ENDPU|nr:uncharacterized protein EPUS_01932 [Endocarpon pusillum Z07020]ERF69602.1 hypothetical protein EPUS_01932 [Endocarpon pusillum Z07020]